MQQPDFKDDRHFIHHDRHILDEDGIGQIGLGGQRVNFAAQFVQRSLILLMLRTGEIKIDRLTIEMR